jgi:hypothetical protein
MLGGQCRPDSGSEYGDADERPDGHNDLDDLPLFIVTDEIDSLDGSAPELAAPEEGVLRSRYELVRNFHGSEFFEQNAVELHCCFATFERRSDQGRLQDDISSQHVPPRFEITRPPRGPKRVFIHERPFVTPPETPRYYASVINLEHR